MKKITVLVACGAGIATSTVVMKKIEDLFKDNKLDANFYQIKISEAASKQDGADMLISTTVLPTNYKIPAITAMPFLTGIGEEQLKEKIVEVAKGLA
ncbi:PTS sugar transporter subunit IIB [Enterococcus sp. LJL99]